jgi:hypothetical protein
MLSASTPWPCSRPFLRRLPAVLVPDLHPACVLLLVRAGVC